MDFLLLAILMVQQAMFADALAYDRFMGRWSRLLAPLLVDFAQIKDGDQVLDVGSGTGSLSSAIVSLRPKSRVVGIDPSAQFVSYAESTRISTNMHFQTGDARALPFPPGQFDVTVSLLVLNFVPDVRTAMAELRRVTRSGGTISAAVWDYGEGMEMLRIFWGAVVALDPTAEPLDEKYMPLCRRGELAQLFRDAGLLKVEEKQLQIETRFASFEDYWDGFLQRQGPAGAYLGRLPAQRAAALRERLKRDLQPHQDATGAITLHARTWAARATVP